MIERTWKWYIDSKLEGELGATSERDAIKIATDIAIAYCEHGQTFRVTVKPV